MASIAQEYTLFEIDRELDTLLVEIEKGSEKRVKRQPSLWSDTSSSARRIVKRPTGSGVSFA